MSWDLFGDGVLRFAHGLAKKVLIADTVSVVADAAFALPAEGITTGAAWIGTIAYTIQIYFDFSGYSDMAIGLGLMFGFHFPENFRRPYSALSITDFWRRWHMTLSNWFRDYLYIPLGGGRGKPSAVYRNLIIVFLLTGVWHGAQWTFIVWGIYHGLLLLAERLTNQRPTEKASFSGARRAAVLLAVVIGWVIFRAPTLGMAVDFYQAMFLSFDWALPAEVTAALSNKAVLVLATGSAVVLLPRDFVMGPYLILAGRRPAFARAALLLAAAPYAFLIVLTGSFSPFLYFQF